MRKVSFIKSTRYDDEQQIYSANPYSTVKTVLRHNRQTFLILISAEDTNETLIKVHIARRSFKNQTSYLTALRQHCTQYCEPGFAKVLQRKLQSYQ